VRGLRDQCQMEYDMRQQKLVKGYYCHHIGINMMYKQVLREQEELADRMSININ
jgi:hypothetical protein